MISLQVVLRRLAMVCVGMSLSVSASVAADLASIPSKKLAEVVEEIENDEATENQDRERVMQLLHYDTRAAVRLRVAESLAIKPMPLTTEIATILARLTSDESVSVRTAALDALISTLLQMNAIERSAEVLQWVVSDDARRRLTAARLLAKPLQILAQHDALQALSIDDDPYVREAAKASWVDHVAQSANDG
jgi:hypothetical protein